MDNINNGYHLGHLFIDCMKNRSDDICIIDAATGEQETKSSVLERSIRLAKSLNKIGLRPNDVLAFGGHNHLDIHIPYYAGLMNGYPCVGVEPTFKYHEILQLFKQTHPKVAFCQAESYDDYVKVTRDLALDTKVISYDGGECTMAKFIESYDDEKPVESFKPADFDTEKVYAWLVSTSGSTGVPKVAAFKHKPIIETIQFFRTFKSWDHKADKTALNLSTVQWISAYFNALTIPATNNIIVHTSAPATTEHIIDIINKYKPITTMVSPSILTLILKHKKKCDLTCFNTITVTGSKIHKDLLLELKSRMRKDAVLVEAYGQTESLGPVLMPDPRGPIGNCGKPMPSVKIKLVDPETEKEVTQPNIAGELWTKGARFSEYYNNREETIKAFTEDGWYKTGDLLYRDENNYYYFVDRLKMLIKYRNHHIIPPEIEEVIFTHEGVEDVSVTSIPDPVDGERPVACVVRRPGSNVTPQEIKDLVASKLSVYKQLTGGVVFLDEIPLTSTGKVARMKLKDLVLTANRE